MRGQKRRANDARVGQLCPEVCSLWASLYEECYKEIAAYLVKHVKCPDDGEDLLQEVFLCLVSREHFPENARAYVYTVARRCLCAYWRKNDMRMMAERALSAHPQITGTPYSALDLDPLEQLDARERNRSLVRAMSQLPPVLAQTLTLRVVDALPVAEAARRARCSPAAIKKRLRRAKLYLKHLCDDTR